MSRLPTIGVSACSKAIGHNLHHCVGDEYLRAALGEPPAVPRLLRRPERLPLAVELQRYASKTDAPARWHDSAHSNLACAGLGAASLAPAGLSGTIAGEGARILMSNYPAIFQAFGEACRGRAGQR